MVSFKMFAVKEIMSEVLLQSTFVPPHLGCWLPGLLGFSVGLCLCVACTRPLASVQSCLDALQHTVQCRCCVSGSCTVLLGKEDQKKACACSGQAQFILPK